MPDPIDNICLHIKPVSLAYLVHEITWTNIGEWKHLIQQEMWEFFMFFLYPGITKLDLVNSFFNFMDQICYCSDTLHGCAPPPQLFYLLLADCPIIHIARHRVSDYIVVLILMLYMVPHFHLFLLASVHSYYQYWHFRWPTYHLSSHSATTVKSISYCLTYCLKVRMTCRVDLLDTETSFHSWVMSKVRNQWPRKYSPLSIS